MHYSFHLCGEMAESLTIHPGLSKEKKYEALLPQLTALTEGEDDVVADCANVVAALKETFGFFWVGIYFVRERNGKEQLVLGPFQGPVACVRIDKGKGVCGTSWAREETIMVPDVGKFPGHISCNSASRSEIVVPVIKNERVVAVIDIDSDKYSDFDETDNHHLSLIARLLAGII